MTRRVAVEWNVEGPVQAEVFVLWLSTDGLRLGGPDGPRPWLIEIGVTDHPLEVVDQIIRGTIGDPMIVHSTSWRRDHDAVILTFLVIIDASAVEAMPSRTVGRAALARSEATTAPREISTDAVLEHALRHLAWLVQDDPVVAAELTHGWRDALADYVPEPFRLLG